jgi:hypothetical protein
MHGKAPSQQISARKNPRCELEIEHQQMLRNISTPQLFDFGLSDFPDRPEAILFLSRSNSQLLTILFSDLIRPSTRAKQGHLLPLELCA